MFSCGRVCFNGRLSQGRDSVGVSFGKFTESVRRQHSRHAAQRLVARGAHGRQFGGVAVRGQGAGPGAGPAAVAAGGQGLQAALAAFARGAGVQAGVTHGVQVSGRCVPQHAGDEGVRGERAALVATVAVVGVVEGDLAVGGRVQPLLAHRPALDVAGQVAHYALAMGVAAAQVHVEVLAVQRAQQPAPVRRRDRRRQHEPPRAHCGTDPAQQFAAVQALDEADRQHEPWRRRAPLAARIQAAGAEQNV